MTYWVYILASKPGGTLYVGVTNDLIRRVYEHREGVAESFTKRYGIKTLVYCEAHETIEAALQREKNLKHWSREWKIDLIVAGNPEGMSGGDAERWCAVDVAAQERLDRRRQEVNHRGYDTTLVNEDPNRLVPLDVARDLER